MKPISLINKPALLLVIIALFLNGIFLWINYGTKQYCSESFLIHSEIAYNVYKYNSVKVNPKRVAFVYDQHQKQNTLLNYSEINHESFGKPTEYRSIYDTIGYGVLLGLLWKITGSLNNKDVQFLQILIFSFLMLFVYQIGLLLFGNATLAFIGSVLHLFFFPLVFQNVQVHRDIWAFYGVIVFLYVSLSLFKEVSSFKTFFVGCVLFSCIQFLRPLIYLMPFIVLSIMVMFSLLKKKHVKKTLSMFLIFGRINWHNAKKMLPQKTLKMLFFSIRYRIKI